MAYKENIGWLLLKTIVKIPNHSPHPKLNLNKIKIVALIAIFAYAKF